MAKPDEPIRRESAQPESLKEIIESWSPNRRAVYQAVAELCEANKPASRQTVSEAAGKAIQIVDDHLRNLKFDGFIRLISNGLFAPVEQEPDRAITGTITASGRYKLEVGDQVLDLSLREARNIGALTSGLGMQFGR